METIKTMFSAQAAKAFVAALVAGIGVAVLAAENGLTLVEALTIAGAMIGAFQATYWTPNAPTTLADPTTWYGPHDGAEDPYPARHREGGYGAVELAIILLIIVIAIVLLFRLV